MSLEPGGRSDKYGNSYENHCLAILLRRLVRGELASVTVEPLGATANYVEFIAEETDGSLRYYQCKGSNATHAAWSIADLQKYHVFQRAEEIVTADAKNWYCFLSPLPYKELDEVCKRARTNGSPADFETYQLTNDCIRRTFNDCMKALGLKRGEPDDVAQAVYILSRCIFEQRNIGPEAARELEATLGVLFMGEEPAIRALLEQYANDTGCYGVKITAKDVVDYMEKRGFPLRDYRGDGAALGRIRVLNETHWDTYYPIHGALVHRAATDSMVSSIARGCSVILHGKAGAGKSGCLEGVIAHLKQRGTLYLAVKLDKHVPALSADAFGRALGLPESPVHCLAALAAGKPCVLILDQLDALRWAGSHSGEALDVCKELIRQATAINRYSGGCVSILFALRTFDLETDKGLKELFAPADPSETLEWIKVNVDHFTREEVRSIIGGGYDALSPRLQTLLMTPSSLYVWSKLDESAQKNSVSSVFELMNEWWQQTLHRCTDCGLREETIAACRDKIVGAMENRGVFSLPQALFIDQAREIGFLASQGLLSCNPSTKSIAFTHQSFLDYFIISDALGRIYSGCDLPSLIGGRSEQTPLVRYRLLSILQNLLESDIALFADQCAALLESAHVRAYFKCAVFEIISQCEAPAEEIFRLVDEYRRKAEWAEYIAQTVLSGHPAFIMRLPELSGDAFPPDELLPLLRSISDREPDFVAQRLCPGAFLNAGQDRRIFWVLGHDASDDSEAMFDLRLRLLRRDPALLGGFWGFHPLIRQRSERAIDLFEIILRSWPEHRLSHLSIASAAELAHYAEECAWPLIERLFPVICEMTAGYRPRWPDAPWDTDYRDWTAPSYQKPAVREITEIVKLALASAARSLPDEMVRFIRGIEYPLSAVGHECIMCAVLNLPTACADEVIAWLLADAEQKIFVFSLPGQGYLSCAAQIIEKFSPACSDALFRALEQYICRWKDPAGHMVSILRERIAVRKAQHFPVYYAYWGHFQKELLPRMDRARLSQYARQLLDTVDRNPWIEASHFGFVHDSGAAKAVVSPVDRRAERLSDRAWLQIISTPPDRLSGRLRSGKGDCYIRANHQAFAADLGKQAAREPLRFARLALRFPEDCYAGYVSAVLYTVSSCSAEDGFDVEAVSGIIRRYGRSSSVEIPSAVARLIQNHAGEAWPDDVIAILARIAREHPHPGEGEYNVTDSADPDHSSAQSLVDNAINCVRGCAVRAIAALLWENEALGETLKSTALAAGKDANPAVRCAAMDCALAYYNIDRAFSLALFTALTEADPRVLCNRDCWEILSREYDGRSAYFRGLLVEACRSEIEDLAVCAAGLLCAVAIYHNDAEALCFLLSYPFSAAQQERISQQAAESFGLDEYHEKSERLLTHLADHSSGKLHGFDRLFFDRHIVIRRDEDFLLRLMRSRQGAHLVHPFLEYLYESDEDICAFARVLGAIGNSLAGKSPEEGGRPIASDLVKCVIRLFDRGKADPGIREICLDIWDVLFLLSLHDSEPLANMIDRFE